MKNFVVLALVFLLFLPFVTAKECLMTTIKTDPQLYDKYQVDGAFKISYIAFSSLKGNPSFKECNESVSDFAYSVYVHDPTGNIIQPVETYFLLNVDSFNNTFNNTYIKNFTDPVTGTFPIWRTLKEGQYIINITSVTRSNVYFYRSSRPSILMSENITNFRGFGEYIFVPNSYQMVVDVPPAWQNEWERQQNNWSSVQKESSDKLLKATNDFTNSSKNLEIYTIGLLAFTAMLVILEATKNNNSYLVKFARRSFVVFVSLVLLAIVYEFYFIG